MYGITVTKEDELLSDYNHCENRRINVHSIAKSVTALAVGFAVSENLLCIDERVVDIFKEELPERYDKCLEELKVEHLLTMSMGQQHPFLMGTQRPFLKEDDWIKSSLSLPFSYRPGTHFMYSDVGPYLAGMAVQKRAHQNLVDYLRPRLFEPLEIKWPTWEVDPRGNTFGSGGLLLSREELHKIGLFCLKKGKWKGRQLLDASWFEDAFSLKMKIGEEGYGYGYCFWREPNYIYMYGYDGQYVFLSEKKEMVITVMASSKQFKELKDIVTTMLEDNWF